MISKNLSHFIGKLCTIFTVPINRDFRTEAPKEYPKILFKYFLGVVESVDESGLLLTQATTGLKTFFILQNIVAIAEEELLDPEDVDDKKEIDRFKPAPSPQSQSPFVDINVIKQLNEELKNKLP